MNLPPPPPPPLAQSAVPWLLALAAAGIPVSLLWDFSWEGTIGIDLPWSPPHVATFSAVLLAGLSALALAGRGEVPGVRLARWEIPLGAGLVLWGTAAFLLAYFFDRWWQANYGLLAGIWHPPQILKATAFFAITLGAWFACRGPGGDLAEVVAGAAVLALIFVVTLAANFANRQHSAAFYQLAAGTYPIVLAAFAIAGRRPFPATTAALASLLLVAAMVWLLPLCPGVPQVAPIYHPRDHLLPPDQASFQATRCDSGSGSW